jgi:hypothetical protein
MPKIENVPIIDGFYKDSILSVNHPAIVAGAFGTPGYHMSERILNRVRNHRVTKIANVSGELRKILHLPENPDIPESHIPQITAWRSWGGYHRRMRLIRSRIEFCCGVV